jgi:hypothetical protein
LFLVLVYTEEEGKAGSSKVGIWEAMHFYPKVTSWSRDVCL